MNAVMRKSDLVETAPMPVNDHDNLAIQVAELRADVRHIQADTTEIKADLRVTNLRFDRFDEKLEALRERTEQGFASLRKEMCERIDSLRQETDGRFGKVDTRFDKVDERFEKVDVRFEKVDERFDKVDERFDKVDVRFDKVDERFEKVEKKIDDVKDSLESAKIWALWMYIGLAGSLFYVLARGFKWL